MIGSGMLKSLVAIGRKLVFSKLRGETGLGGVKK